MCLNEEESFILKSPLVELEHFRLVALLERIVMFMAY